MNKIVSVFLLASGMAACAPGPEPEPVPAEQISVTPTTVGISTQLRIIGEDGQIKAWRGSIGEFTEVFDFAADQRCLDHNEYRTGKDVICMPFDQLNEQGKARVEHARSYLERGPGEYLVRLP